MEGAEDLVVSCGEDYPEIRQSVRRVCADFPGSYWRELEDREGYPSEFVQALTDAGFLSALIPEAYGGSGLGVTEATIKAHITAIFRKLGTTNRTQAVIMLSKMSLQDTSANE